MTTDEAAGLYQDHNMGFGSSLKNEELPDITEKNIDELLAEVKHLNEHQVVIGGRRRRDSRCLMAFCDCLFTWAALAKIS